MIKHLAIKDMAKRKRKQNLKTLLLKKSYTETEPAYRTGRLLFGKL